MKIINPNLTKTEGSIAPKLPELRLSIQPRVIEHLGINMYTAIPPVISEIVANSWDADAKKVWLTIPAGPFSENYEMVIRDSGTGMTYQELIDKYLVVGRNRRLRKIDGKEVDLPEETPLLKRRVLGRKGIGKLSVFGVAKQVKVKTVKDHKVTEFEMDVDKIREVKSSDYFPKVYKMNEDIAENDSTTVTLRNLKRKKAVNPDDIIKGLARRFTLLSENFQVFVNNRLITPEDRKIKDIQWKWQYDESLPGHPNWKVKGEIFTRKATVRDEESRGVAVFAGGKLVQEPTFFDQTSGKELAYSYMMGEIHADFLDDVNDVVSSSRSSINWESDEGQALKEWGSKKVYDVSWEWYNGRMKEKMDKIGKDPSFQFWLDGLSRTEKTKASKVISAIVGSEDVSEEKAVSLANFIKDSFAYAAFQDLSKKIDETNPEDLSLIIESIKEWEYLEAKEFFRIAEGRIPTIEKLRWYVENNPNKIHDIQQYLKKFPWIMDPKWTWIHDETKYSDMLRKKFPNHKKDHRIDFLCFNSWSNIIVVELKEPTFTIGEKDLDQIKQYVQTVKKFMEKNDEDSVKTINGYLIFGLVEENKKMEREISHLNKNGIYMKKYSELLFNAIKIHKEMAEKYKNLEETSRTSTIN